MTTLEEKTQEKQGLTGVITHKEYYDDEINLHLRSAAKELLIHYSKVPPEEVESHIHTVRQKAWNVHEFPCIGQFRFLDLSISLSPHYPSVLARLKTGNETFLDLGCCFGQDIRKLVYDGVPGEMLYGCDLRPDFFDCGFDLFRDRDTLKATLFEANVFDAQSGLTDLYGKIDIIYIGSFLHLFGYTQQVEVCVKIVKLLNDKVGSMVLGRQVGDPNPGEYHAQTQGVKFIMRHSPETFAQMWEEVGKLTGTKWQVDANLKKIDDKGMVTSEEPERKDKKEEDPGIWLPKPRLTFSVIRTA